VRGGRGLIVAHLVQYFGVGGEEKGEVAARDETSQTVESDFA